MHIERGLDKMKNKRFIALFILTVLVASFCINVSAARPYEKSLDYPYRAMGGLFEGCIVRAENGIEFSDASSNFNSKTLTVYKRPYAVEERRKESGELYEATLFENDEDHKNLCIENIKTYLEKAGEKVDGDFGQTPATYKYYYLGQNVNVSSMGSRMTVSVKNTTVEYVTDLYESGRLTDDPYIKAALEAAGCGEYSYTRTDYKRFDHTDGGIYYVYPSGAKAPQPYLAMIEFYVRVLDDAENKSYISIDFQLNGYEGYEAGEYKTISYEKAFEKLKDGEYRSLYTPDDVSWVTKDDVLCELVYTDAIDLHYMMPVYKFYVRIKDESWLTQEKVGEDEELYFFFYVPAVEMNEQNPQTSDAAVTAAVGALSLSLAGAALLIRKKTV